MKAMILGKIVSLDESDAPLSLVELPIPEPGPTEVLIRVIVCGVCHTELDQIEGRVVPTKLPIVPGHQVVGIVQEVGRGVTRHKVSDRVGVGWIFSSTGAVDENLSPDFRATGRDANGGYAEYMTIGEDYAYPIPPAFSYQEAAPLLCAGAVGYRALRLTGLVDGEPLGLTGFGGSAHLVLQMARHRYPNSPLYVFARDLQARDFARALGAVWAGDTADRSPEPLRAIIDTTPVWRPVVEALANLRPGGRLVINAIRKEDHDKGELLRLSYHEHLWMEREIKSVANVTQHDIREFLLLAAEIAIKPAIEAYSLRDANRALSELKRGPIRGAKVLTIDGPPPMGL
jgi:propanol-preferring alcohol dehydrogenase